MVAGNADFMCCIQKVCIIIGACAVLHNIAILLNEPMEDGEVDDEMNRMILMMYIMVLIKDKQCEIIFVAPILAR